MMQDQDLIKQVFKDPQHLRLVGKIRNTKILNRAIHKKKFQEHMNESPDDYSLVDNTISPVKISLAHTLKDKSAMK